MDYEGELADEAVQDGAIKMLLDNADRGDAVEINHREWLIWRNYLFSQLQSTANRELYL